MRGTILAYKPRSECQRTSQSHTTSHTCEHNSTKHTTSKQRHSRIRTHTNCILQFLPVSNNSLKRRLRSRHQVCQHWHVVSLRLLTQHIQQPPISYHYLLQWRRTHNTHEEISCNKYSPSLGEALAYILPQQVDRRGTPLDLTTPLHTRPVM